MIIDNKSLISLTGLSSSTQIALSSGADPFLSVPASAFTKKPKTQTAALGSAAVFEAETEKPDAKVRWQRDGKDIAAGDKYDITAEAGKHSFTIKDVAKEDAAGYCVIAAASKVKFELKVKEPEPEPEPEGG